MTGYSSTPLAQELSLKQGMKAWFKGMPDSVRSEIDPERLDLEELTSACDGMDVAHMFHTDQAAMSRDLKALRELIQPSGFVWVSWPKQTAQLTTDITGETVRAAALPLGMVGVKECAVDDTWSGLKLMIRKPEC